MLPKFSFLVREQSDVMDPKPILAVWQPLIKSHDYLSTAIFVLAKFNSLVCEQSDVRYPKTCSCQVV